MRTSSRDNSINEKPQATVGLDIGDLFIHYCRLNQKGGVVEEARIRTTGNAVRRPFEGEGRMRIAMTIAS